MDIKKIIEEAQRSAELARGATPLDIELVELCSRASITPVPGLGAKVHALLVRGARPHIPKHCVCAFEYIAEVDVDLALAMLEHVPPDARQSPLDKAARVAAMRGQFASAAHLVARGAHIDYLPEDQRISVQSYLRSYLKLRNHVEGNN